MKPTCALMLAWSLSALISYTTGLASQAWPFGINANGTPLIPIQLISLPRTELAPAIGLSHRLVYDGERFVSKWNVTGIESWLVPYDAKLFRWQPFAGESSIMKLGVTTRISNRDWVLTRNENSYSVASVDEVEEYTYENCVPVRARVESRIYEFERRGTLLSIKRNSPNSASMAEITYNDNGTISMAAISGVLLYFDYDSLLQLSSILNNSGSQELVRIRYERGLLSDVVTPLATKHYHWSNASWGEYFQPITEIPPYISNDSEYEYLLRRDSRQIVVTFRDTRSAAAGFWRLDLQTRRVEIVNAPKRRD